MEIQKISDYPFGNFRKMWVASRGDPLFPLFSVFPGGARTIHQLYFQLAIGHDSLFVRLR